ncbi:MAG: TIGR03067 domain-containing protein [Planctomycetes bacterium]|nr:TIGR03067 domain-containing protein [Planctomycetota bacterium]
MHRFFSVLCVLTTPLLLNAGNDDVRKELKALQGEWKTVGLEAGGKPFPKEAVFDFTFIVGADGKSIGRMPKSEYQSKVSVDPKKNPKTIENVHATGQHKGKMQYGIYKLEGEKWIVCMTAPGAAASDRPKSFDTKDTANVVFIFERIKEDKKP